MVTPEKSTPITCPKCSGIVWIHGDPTDDLARRLAIAICPGCKRRKRSKREPETIRQPFADL